jgi:hypothetical protein
VCVCVWVCVGVCVCYAAVQWSLADLDQGS